MNLIVPKVLKAISTAVRENPISINCNISGEGGPPLFGSSSSANSCSETNCYHKQEQSTIISLSGTNKANELTRTGVDPRSPPVTRDDKVSSTG